MKKISFLQSFLITSLIATSSFAGPLKIKLGGSLEFLAIARDLDQNLQTNNSNLSNLKKYAFDSKAKIALSAAGSLENGLIYGGVLGIRTNTNTQTNFSRDNLDRSYIFLQHEAVGRLELGSNYNAYKTMKLDANSLALGSGGAMGDWYKYADVKIYGYTDLDMYFNMVSDSYASPYEEPRNITYYSPKYNNFQLGISYTPDASNRGMNQALQTAVPAKPILGTLVAKDQFDLALNYSNKFDQITLAGSLTGKFSKSKLVDANTSNINAANTNNAKIYAIGGSIGFRDFTAAASYGRNAGKKLFNATLPKLTYSYWSAGLSYVQDHFGASVTYLDYGFTGYKLAVTSVAANYFLAPGITPYIEMTSFNVNKSGNPFPSTWGVIDRGKGSIYMIGTKLAF